jgi:hypothetical protein
VGRPAVSGGRRGRLAGGRIPDPANGPSRIRSTVSQKSRKPRRSTAWGGVGISRASAAVRALTVRRPRLGGQSKTVRSNSASTDRRHRRRTPSRPRRTPVWGLARDRAGGEGLPRSPWKMKPRRHDMLEGDPYNLRRVRPVHWMSAQEGVLVPLAASATPRGTTGLIRVGLLARTGTRKPIERWTLQRLGGDRRCSTRPIPERDLSSPS